MRVVAWLPILACVLLALGSFALPSSAYLDPHLVDRLSGPGWDHLCGTDELGRDVLARLAVGARVSLAFGVAVVAACAFAGAVIGCAVGMSGRFMNAVLQAVADSVTAFPGFLLSLALVAVLGPGLPQMFLAFVSTGWVGFARHARSRVLAIRESTFIEALRAIGCPRLRLFFAHLLPNIGGPVLVQAALWLGPVIAAEGAMSFLGFGAQPPMPSWGAMINEGRRHLLDCPRLMIAPGLCLFVALFGAAVAADRLRQELENRGHEERA